VYTLDLLSCAHTRLLTDSCEAISGRLTGLILSHESGTRVVGSTPSGPASLFKTCENDESDAPSQWRWSTNCSGACPRQLARCNAAQCRVRQLFGPLTATVVLMFLLTIVFICAKASVATHNETRQCTITHQDGHDAPSSTWDECLVALL
jgi:hypothetical protein